MTYDNMGNITSLGRYDNVPGSGRTQIDTLTYSYSFHRVNQVNDASAYTGTAGFTDLVQQVNEYMYDGNGNQLKDLNKGISSISYNVLNLPQTITKNDGSTVVYVYSASGGKLRKLYTTGGNTTATEYDNGIEYDNSTTDIAFSQTEEGRSRNTGAGYAYEYDLKDHLGNTRVTITPDPNDATQQTAKLLQENDYYAFGYGIQSTQQTISPKNEYLYNHKELQEETGLYDYGARFYDPVIGRWTSVDPKAELSRRFSDYTYADDNPIRFIDPDGMTTDVPKKKKEKAQTGSYTITFESGKTYSGKGSLARAKQSARRQARDHDDPVDTKVAENGIDWTPAKNDREAFKDENDRINANGGAGNKEENYNEIESPGKKYAEEDKKKAEKDKKQYRPEEPDAASTPSNNSSTPARGLHPAVKTGLGVGTVITILMILLSPVGV